MNTIKGRTGAEVRRTKCLSAQDQRQNCAAQASPRLLLALLLVVLLPLFAVASAPSWWTTPDVISSGSTANDYAAINQGQLKNLAVKASAHLHAKLPSSVWSTTQGIALTNLIYTFQTNTTSAYNYNAVNLGQLKAVAKPFYDVLKRSDIAYVTDYPWSNSSTPANDYAMANIGQAKNLFSFDLTGFTPPSGEIPDSWRQEIVDRSTTDQYKTIADITDEDDFDGDGVTNKQEYLDGTDPLNAASVHNPPATQTDAQDQGHLKVFTPLF